MRRVVRNACVSLCIASLLSCGSSQIVKPHRVDRQDRAGSAYVTVLSIAPWDDYVELLQPKFTLSVEDALAKAVPNTRDEDERFLQSISAAFKVSTPATTQTTTAATTTAGTTTTTADKTATDITHDANVDATALPAGTSALTTPLDKEPMLQYLVATALYQEVQLLSRYIKDAAARKDLVPYVLRLQVTLMPMARNEPYDAYSNISFIYGPPLPAALAASSKDADRRTLATNVQSITHDVQWLQRYVQPEKTLGYTLEQKTANDKRNAKEFEGGLPCTNLPAPVISPLLVTDNLEGAVHGQTSEYVRQFLASVVVMQADYSGQATGRFRSDLLRSILGRDINSLLTVARVNDSTLRVRLGAVQAPTGSYAMIPQTHNVTILLMVPNPSSLTAPCDNERTIRFVSKTSFVDANTGRILPARDVSTETQLVSDIGRKLDDYGVKLKWSPLILRARYVNLALFAATNNRQSFNTEFQQILDLDGRNACDDPANATAFKPCLSQFARDVIQDGVWSELVNLATGGPYHIGTVDLPSFDPPTFPEQAYDILLADDGKAAASTSIGGCSKLVKGAVTAELLISPTVGTPKRLLATSVDVADTGDSVKATFPSPAKLLAATDLAAATYQLTLRYPKNPRKKYDGTDGPVPFTIPTERIKYVPAEPDKPPVKAVTMIVSSTVVRSTDGEGKLTVEFQHQDKAKDVTRFDISGGDIADVSAVPSTMLAAGKLRTIVGSGVVTLTLRNLLDGQTLNIVTNKVGDDGSLTLVDSKPLSIHDVPSGTHKGSS
jgi:hypothetical protein